MAPAVQAMLRYSEQGKPMELRSVSSLRRLRNHFGEVSRAARHCAAIRCLGSASIVLPGVGHKLQEAREELLAAGVPAGSLQTLGASPERFSRIKLGILALLLIVPLALQRWLLWPRVSRQAAYSRQYFNIICLYAAYKRCLSGKGKKHWWLIIGDLSPFLIALSAACRVAGERVISWQYGYQDFKHYPVIPHVAIVLNRKGLELARVKDVGSFPLFQRKTLSVKSVSFKSRPMGAIGVVLNAYSRADVLETIRAIKKQLGCDIKLRPHPRDTSISEDKLSCLKGVALAQEATLEDFCEGVDWVVCGNSTSALKIRAMGYPVCQYFGLDKFFDDHFEYSKLGVLPAFSAVDDIVFDKVVTFYASDQAVRSLESLLGRDINSSVKPLSHFSKHLDANEA